MIRVVIILLALPALCAAQISIEWTDGPQLPLGLGGHAAVSMSDGVFVLGGTYWRQETKRWNDEVFVFRKSAKNWLPSAKLQVPVAFSGVIERDGELLMLGGWVQGGSIARCWREPGDRGGRGLRDLPAPRTLAAAAIIADVVYLIGGATSGDDLSTATASCMKLNAADPVEWKPIAPLPTARGICAVAALGGRIFVFGGIDAGKRDLAESLCYDPRRDSWTALAALPAARRGAAAVAIDDRHILIVGGCRNEQDQPRMLSETLLYDTQANAFRALKEMPVAAVCQQAVFHRGDVMVMGGEDAPRKRTDRTLIGRIARGAR